MDWKQYEKEVLELFRSFYPNATITADVSRTGQFSKVKRQLDILVEAQLAGRPVLTVIDAKYLSRKVDVKAVDSFISMLNDVGAQRGILISQKGYSEAAYNRAHFGPEDVELDILNFSELREFQAGLAIPYAGNNAALLLPPFGWIVDGARREESPAFFYRRGRDLHQAVLDREFAYLNFWNRKKDGHCLTDLIDLQEKNLRARVPDCSIRYLDSVIRPPYRTATRLMRSTNYLAPECTGFVEFEDFIAFIVMFTPENRLSTNLRKLEQIMEKIMPLRIKRSAGKG